MKFKLPESLSDLDLDALNALLKDAVNEYGDLAVIDDAELTDEQIDDLEALAGHVDTINAAVAEKQGELDARAERVAAAKAKLDSAKSETETTDEEPEDGDDETEDEGDEPEAEVEVVVPDDASEIIEEEAVTASGTKRPVVRRAASKAPKAEAPAPADKPTAALIASADVRGFAAGQKLTDMSEAAVAFQNRLKAFPQGGHRSGARQQVGAFTINKVVDERFHLDGRDLNADMDKIFSASKELREGGALVAAGGWCAPSETVYNIPSLETVSGILSVPEVTMNRGGINFTKGPDFASIYADTGFTQTEAQAEAGTEKHFTEVTCPEFSEVRLDAIGWALTAPILTGKAYPELIRRFLDGAVVAHAHKRNAYVINKIVAGLGSAINANEFGSAVGDVLTALELAADRLRYIYRLAIGARLEGFAPVWLKSVLRADIAYRGGMDALQVTDAQINAWLSNRGISLQWVYDWQDLGATGATYPATAKVALYPAGTFVVGTTDVINIDAVYDTAGLKVNEYTAAFFEEGVAVFNPVGSGSLVEVALDYRGRKGAENIGLVVPPTA